VAEEGVRFVTAEDIERERRELRALQTDFDRLLRRQRDIARSREDAARRLDELTAELETLRATGWAYLGWFGRRRWTRLRDVLIPDAQERLARWIAEQDRHFKEVLVPLRDKIRELEREIARKVLPLLHRIKIRLYAVKERRKYYLTFQGFFDVDAILDPKTGLPRWDWWLTKQEIAYAKYHFHGYWKGGVTKPKPFGVPDIKQAYLTETEGITIREYLDMPGIFLYTKNVPDEYIRLARTLNVREIITGISNIKPRPVKEPEKEMGVYCQYMMIIDENGIIKWMDKRDRWVWRPTREMIDRVKKELGIK